MTTRQLEADIIEYLEKEVGVKDADRVGQLLGVIRKAAHEFCIVDYKTPFEPIYEKTLYHAQIKRGERFYPRLCWHFSALHYRKIEVLVMKYEEITAKVSIPAIEPAIVIHDNYFELIDPSTASYVCGVRIDTLILPLSTLPTFRETLKK
ncbi:MAG: hypothetical protein F6K14_00560 [Symploca sp. SIO2C1]|nr:hypothetical protein [Symploca sp. SIO2C1]